MLQQKWEKKIQEVTPERNVLKGLWVYTWAFPVLQSQIPVVLGRENLRNWGGQESSTSNWFKQNPPQQHRRETESGTLVRANSPHVNRCQKLKSGHFAGSSKACQVTAYNFQSRVSQTLNFNKDCVGSRWLIKAPKIRNSSAGMSGVKGERPVCVWRVICAVPLRSRQQADCF